MSERVAVVGCGNILMRDDGLGVRAVERLWSEGVPEYVEVIDAGTALLDVLPGLDGVGRIVVVDAVRAGGRPGDVYRAPMDALEPPSGLDRGPVSLHDLALREAFGIARLQGVALGDAVVVGMEPGDLGAGMELSEPVERAMPRLVEAIRNEFLGTKE